MSDLGYDDPYSEDLSDILLGEPAPDAEGLGLLHAEGERKAAEERIKTRKKFERGPNAPAPSGIAVVKGNLEAARAELATAQEFYDNAESIADRAEAHKAITEIQSEIAGLETEVRVYKLGGSDPTTALQLDYEQKRDLVDQYRATHPNTYEDDATYKRLRAEADTALLTLDQTSKDVELRNDRVQSAAVLEGYAQTEAMRAYNAELARLDREATDQAKAGNYSVAGTLQDERIKLSKMVPEKSAVYKAAFAEARTRIALEAQQSAESMPRSREEAMQAMLQSLPIR